MPATVVDSPSALALRDDFLINPDVVFLNHGSFGACPKPVFAEYQRWQRDLEWQPVEFIGRRLDGLMNDARHEMAAYVGADPEHLVFVPNATAGLNIVARSLDLQPGDEILSNNHEYGALKLTWELVCRKTGAVYVEQQIPLPVHSQEEIVEAIWSGVTPRTKVVFLSHITSPTALIFPVEEIARRAREAGILCMIDGAHAPGQVPVDVEKIGAFVYSGNNHKWLCAPKGSGFLYVHPDLHETTDSLIVSWGWREEGASFVVRNQVQGTRDSAAYLATPAAIRYQAEHDWDTVRTRCHELAREARRRICALTGLEPVQPDSPDFFRQMVAIPLPPYDHMELKTRLYDDYNIEVPLTMNGDHYMIRVSFQGYNTEEDLEKLITALVELKAV
jgi:isopenicillin-N epimerase